MKIGLTYTGTLWKHENYVRWIRNEDAEIEVIRLDASLGNLADVSECAGLVLSGGVDIDPELYDGPMDYVKAPADGFQTERDLFEQAALQLSWEMGLPVLGVCRGLQLINVSCGGTLVQDLGEDKDLVHENSMGVDKEHPVGVVAGSQLAGIVGCSGGIVNSAHHQAIDRLGEGLRVNCRAEDGTIEGVEWEMPAGKPWMMAVQWHPERMYVNRVGDELLYRPIRERFINAIKSKYADH
ncbi:MAG: gamma-glutamyl-gamma-aminobutyrate hydrolase family protein [Bacteroidetes bacterium]|nr:gamma-glutamyl-gamma-aminobutyrate hydrolase family protein [Bacteroidota bacterium]